MAAMSVFVHMVEHFCKYGTRQPSCFDLFCFVCACFSTTNNRSIVGRTKIKILETDSNTIHVAVCRLL